MRNAATRLAYRQVFATLQFLLALLITVLARWKLWATRDSGTSTTYRRTLFDHVIPKGLVGAEIGVYKGNLSTYILAVNSPSKLHLIDPWWKHEKTWSWATGDKSTARSFAIILLNLIEQVQNGQVEFHIGNDLQVLTEFPDGYFDWVYLDSTHEYSQTKQELALLQTKVKPAGLITGDDWQDDPRHIHHGVSKAVNEFLEDNPSWKIVFREHTQWALREEPS